MRKLPGRWLTIAVFTLLAAPARADLPPWENAGLAGTPVITVVADWEHLLAGAPDGLHVQVRQTGQWLPLAREGAAGWPVTAVTRAPGLPLRHVTAREAPGGGGALALTVLPDGATTVVATGLAGAPAQVGTLGHFGGNRLWAVGPAGVALQSGDQGETWVELPGHGFAQPRAFLGGLDIVGGDIVARAWLAGDDRLAWTIDFGATWVPDVDGLPAAQVRDMHLGETCFVFPGKSETNACEWLVVATDDGAYLRQYEDEPWFRILDEPCLEARVVGGPHSLEAHVLALAADGRLLHAAIGIDRPIVPVWEDWTPPLAGSRITAFDAGDAYLAVGTDTGGVITRAMPTISTPVPPAALPLRLSAAPNPFNPSTVLRFEAPSAGPARLAIYDLQGRLVDVLLDGDLPAAGPVERDWRPAGLASGVFVARLECGGAVASCRLALVR